MGTNECSQSASKSSWDSQHVNMVLKMAHFHKSSRHNELILEYRGTGKHPLRC